MTDIVKIDELEFVKLIEAKEIEKRLDLMASLMNESLKGENPLFLVVLNGAFIFAADILRKLTLECDIQFVDAKSYDGLTSTGEVIINDEKLNVVKERN